MFYDLEDKKPKNSGENWVAPNATIIGDVTLEKNSSVWFNAVIRGDNENIHVGEGSNVQDGSVLHTDPGYPLKIGGKFVLKVDGTKRIVFLASPKPQNSEEKNWAWTQVQDDKNLIEYLKVGNKAIMEAESHRGTITKDTFELAGFTKAIEMLHKVCKEINQ